MARLLLAAGFLRTPTNVGAVNRYSALHVPHRHIATRQACTSLRTKRRTAQGGAVAYRHRNTDLGGSFAFFKASMGSQFSSFLGIDPLEEP